MTFAPASVVVKAQSCQAAHARPPTSSGSCQAYPRSSSSSDGAATCGGAMSPAKDEQEEEEETSSTRSLYGDKCGLFMAPSTIPNAGWGVFAGRNYAPEEVFEPLDVAHSVVDYYEERQRLLAKPNTTTTTPPPLLPEWIMDSYHWTAIVTHALFDAQQLYTFMPGIGMLANSYAGLLNVDHQGAGTRERLPRSTPSAGALTHYQQVAFAAKRDIVAGEELFVEYGDDWFLTREAELGLLPLESDFALADELVQRWEGLLVDVHSPVSLDVWDTLVMGAMAPLLRPRLRQALPKTSQDALDAASYLYGTAQASFLPHVPHRSLEWLHQNAYCLDNMYTKISSLLSTPQHGAFASRPIQQGGMIAPVPLVHFSRKHLELTTVDEFGNELWKGSQLLLNYCFGHHDSSILLFPYSPGMNSINHAAGLVNATPNVALRWSTTDARTQELRELNATQLLEQNAHAGLLMELYALRDIDIDEELLLDYGPDWTATWREHEQQWPTYADWLVHFDDYQSAWDFEINEEIYTLEDQEEDQANNTTGKYPPSYVQTRVWVNVDELTQPERTTEEEAEWFLWAADDWNYLDATLACDVLSADYIDDRKDTYRVECTQSNGDTIKIKDVPWHAITFVEKNYTGHQFLRQAFRHEIRLSDSLFPDAWKDLAIADEPEGSCGLFLAESAIPNSGLGMYTAKGFDNAERLFHGEVVIQVEDYEVNMKLARWYHGDFSDTPLNYWLLDSYYWHSHTSVGQFEGQSIFSIIPGLGMLANSHPGLINCDIQKPTQTHDLNRLSDPGAGASTTYHDLHYLTTQSLEVGEEIFVRYGDAWFEQRPYLGSIPLENDFIRADAMLAKFLQVSRNVKERAAKDLWNLVRRALDTKAAHRLSAALPVDLKDVKTAQSMGTAKYSTPNRVRSLDWLNKHGRCLDNIKPGRSTLKQAGRGAFATRRIKKGQVIVPMPLVHFHRYDLGVYYSDNFDDPSESVRYLGQQLLLNYCYGHKDSSLVLFPYSPVSNYVNHNATQCNAKLRWSTLSNHQKSWLGRSPDDLRSEDHAGLIMELVATRDIAAGDEVFLDYGTEWEKAWREHVLDWVPPEGAEDYLPASSLNERMEWIRTKDELEVDPYPSETVGTFCHVGLNREILMSDKDDGLIRYMWKYYDGLYQERENSFPCEVLSRLNVDADNAFDRKDSIRPVDVKYEVLVHLGEYAGGDAIFVGLPRMAIQFYDHQYTSDLFLRTAFRHEIHLPDEMVPEEWRDLKKGE